MRQFRSGQLDSRLFVLYYEDVLLFFSEILVGAFIIHIENYQPLFFLFFFWVGSVFYSTAAVIQQQIKFSSRESTVVTLPHTYYTRQPGIAGTAHTPYNHIQ
jgi:hypothetical protein